MAKQKTELYSYGDKVSNFRFSEVDIIIPFHGQYTHVRNLVESILLHTKSNPYLITLVDDASPNRAFSEKIIKMAPIRLIRLDDQVGFGGALKAGYEQTTKPWMVFMHSDCLINNHMWLQKLGETILGFKDKSVRLVHAITDNPMTEHPLLKPTKQDETHKDVVVDSDDPLPLICAMTHRDLFKHLGGFIKEYPYAGYEDVELFYRMKKHKMKQAVCGGSWVRHEGGATINEVIARNNKVKEIMEGNYDLCMRDIS